MKETTTTTATDHDTDTHAATESSPAANYRSTIGDVDHTNPHTDTPFGAAIAYKRGPTVVADGGREPDGSRVGRTVRRSDSGERGAIEEDQGEESDGDGDTDASTDGEERMCDVEHAPPESEGVNRIHERGGEGREGK